MHFVPVETLEQVLKEAMPDPVSAGADSPRLNVDRPH
jgi:hypothetical protein